MGIFVSCVVKTEAAEEAVACLSDWDPMHIYASISFDESKWKNTWSWTVTDDSDYDGELVCTVTRGHSVEMVLAEINSFIGSNPGRL